VLGLRAQDDPARFGELLLMIVPDPNCDGRGWVPVYSGALDASGNLVVTGTKMDIRCMGTGLIEVPNVFPSRRLALIEAGYDPDNPDPDLPLPKTDGTQELKV
jgi:hypothetical protein